MGQGIQEWTISRLASANFTWSILEYFDPYIVQFSHKSFRVYLGMIAHDHHQLTFVMHVRKYDSESF